MTPAPSLRIHLCGPLVVEREGQRLEALLPGRQGRLLFAFLVCNRHRVTRRSQLIDVLWPGEAPPASDGALNALVSKLRRVLGPQSLDGRAGVQLRLGGESWIDVEAALAAVHRAESAVAAGDWRRAWGPALTALFTAQREFLPTEDAPWVERERDRLAGIHLRSLEAYATSCLALGGTELAGAVRSARELVALAPLHESGHRLLMRALAAQGNAAEALRVYARLCDSLRDELGVSPSAETRAVHEALVHA